MDLTAPYRTNYATNAQFYNANGVTYSGGDAIWTWMRNLFGQFEKVEHEMKVAFVIPGHSGTEGSVWNLVLLDCDTTFWMKDPLGVDGITVPRMLHFLVGRAEGEERGSDGLLILEAKTWWDSKCADGGDPEEKECVGCEWGGLQVSQRALYQLRFRQGASCLC